MVSQQLHRTDAAQCVEDDVVRLNRIEGARVEAIELDRPVRALAQLERNWRERIGRYELVVEENDNHGALQARKSGEQGEPGRTAFFRVELHASDIFAADSHGDGLPIDVKEGCGILGLAHQRSKRVHEVDHILA